MAIEFILPAVVFKMVFWWIFFSFIYDSLRKTFLILKFGCHYREHSWLQNMSSEWCAHFAERETVCDALAASCHWEHRLLVKKAYIGEQKEEFLAEVIKQLSHQTWNYRTLSIPQCSYSSLLCILTKKFVWKREIKVECYFLNEKPFPNKEALHKIIKPDHHLKSS